MNALFYLFAAAACLGAVAVVVSQSVVRMAFWLIVSLGSTAGLFFLLDADFVAATQLLIYVGGTLVLLVFGVMLTASGPYLKIKASPAEGFLAAGVGVLFLFIFMMTVWQVDWEANNTNLRIAQGTSAAGYNAEGEGNTGRPLGLSLIGLRPDKDLGQSELSTGYLLPFEIVSVHLLVVLVGAAYLARAKRRNVSTAGKVE
ncbi:MAG: NADH-quinone oxidoreductase subunit J [Phycisphaerales bacterium]|nr:NADH-quinone oxidoreductase subunit J [Phycisphaerales bacterium]